MKPIAPIAVTCGDPSGIGGEIARNWALHHREHRHQFCFLGSQRWVAPFKALGFPVQVCSASDRWQEGVLNQQSAQAALDAMERAAVGTQAGEFSAVVTLPVSKANLAGIGYAYPGQTEFFAHHWGGDATMAFAWDHFLVSLVTWHIPLKDVPENASPSALERAIITTCDALQRLGRGQAVAVCGLNPHAGEDGLLGNEEKDEWNPLLKKLSQRLRGLHPCCLPGDTVWQELLQGRWQGIVSPYHDQALAAVKSVAFDRAVNVSLGLPFLRVSPDHGTAVGLVGKNRASWASFAASCQFAYQWITHRTHHE